MFVILEGFDKVGKTTVLKAFGKLNSWEQIIIDRGPAGYLFYDELAGRASKKRNKQYTNDLRKFTRYCDYCVVFLHAKADDIRARHKEVGEVLPFAEKTYDIDKIQQRYAEICKKYGVDKVMAINTSVLSLESTMEEIAKFINDVSSRQ